jgi:hypothetical protein
LACRVAYGRDLTKTCSRPAMKTRPPGVVTGPWKTESGKSKAKPTRHAIPIPILQMLQFTATQVPDLVQSESDLAVHRVLFEGRMDSRECQLAFSGPRGEATRAKQFLSLVAPLSPLLPVDITMVASDHDLGSWILGSGWLHHVGPRALVRSWDRQRQS